MQTLPYSHAQRLAAAQLTPADLHEIQQRRRPHNRLGFAYQLVFVRLANRFPSQQPWEIDEGLLTFVSVQLAIPAPLIQLYSQRQATLSAHQEQVRSYLGLRRFGEAEAQALAPFLLAEARRLEQSGPLLSQAQRFLQEAGILSPADDTLRRLVAGQRQQARAQIFGRITDSLSAPLRAKLDALLVAGDGHLTPLHPLKQPPGRPSPVAMLRLAEKLAQIQETEILTLDLTWLNNNYQRSLTRYAQRCSADRLRELRPEHRYAVLVCFLWQLYRDTIDHMIDMHDKIMTGIYQRAQTELDEEHRQQRPMLRRALTVLQTLAEAILDESIRDAELRQALFSRVEPERLVTQIASVADWLNGAHSHVFHRVVQRFAYLRQFAPAFLQHLQFRQEEGASATVVEAIAFLRQLNQEHKRKLPDSVPLDFVPKALRPLVVQEGEVDKRTWECVLLTTIRDEIRAGNVYVEASKRFGRFADFFIPDAQWAAQRERFFQRAGLPTQAEQVPAFLSDRLQRAYDRFLARLPANTYAKVDATGWQLSADAAQKLDGESAHRLAALQGWLAAHLREIKLPELLIEVDNALHFTQHFLTPAQPNRREAEQVCAILATLMAHGCNIGPYTMARLTEGITYRQIRQVTDWQLTEEAQRQALAQVVNAISQLDVTQAWGEGKSSSSDGQRFRLRRQVLQRTYSHRLNDYALEFYAFVADNYAPFYSTVIECTDRDAAYVLDGLLYNESDLPLAEHYTDTHGYTEINFAAFAMLGRRFAPRIRGLHQQRIYCIGRDQDYGPLTPLLNRWDRTIHLDWISEQWDRMGQFYASLESGHATASTALKRLAAYSGKNHFYRANRELGRLFKTEYILQYMSDPATRQRVQRGLLKGEEIHALARQVAYGKQGQVTARDLDAQQDVSHCLTLLMACIIYWQAKEINRVLLECEPEAAGVDLSLLEHISPIGWANVILYGEYVLNRSLVRS